MKPSYLLSILLVAAAQVEADEWWCQCRKTTVVKGHRRTFINEKDTRDTCRTKEGEMVNRAWCKISLPTHRSWEYAWSQVR
ncbi:hypothetical protein LX36DRAFT_185276 [Colletotrichum falcatum]|nr:hypothetical protein LX36DRAFT_185276 [Colletotrichum falcatum]